MTYTFDEEKAWDNITDRIRKDEAQKTWTMFGVACVNRDLSSHGVTVAPDAATAFELAKMANAADRDCTYYPVGVSILPAVIVELMQQLANEPPEGRTA